MVSTRALMNGFIAAGGVIIVILIGLSLYFGGVDGSRTTIKLLLLANLVAVALSAYMMFRAAGVEKGSGKTPWLLLALAMCSFVVVEVIRFYFFGILGYKWPIVWGFIILSYILVVAALAVKFARVAKSPASLWRSLLVAGTFLISSSVIIYVYNAVFKIRNLTPILFGAAMVVPIADTIIAMLAVYIAATYGKGVMGRPWLAFAVAAALSSIGDIANFYADCTSLRHRHILTYVVYLANFGAYYAAATGALYQRFLISGHPLKKPGAVSAQHEQG